MVRIILMPEEVEQIRKYLLDKSKLIIDEIKIKGEKKRLIRKLASVVFFLIQLETGARMGEVLNLKRNDFIEVKGRFLIKFIKEKKRKGQEKQRFVFVSKETSEVIKFYMPLSSKFDFERIFPFGRKRVFQIIKKIGEELFHLTGDAKYLQIHTHVFRSSWIYYAMAKGIPIHDVQKLVGHEKITTTQRYIEKFYPKIQKNIFEL